MDVGVDVGSAAEAEVCVASTARLVGSISPKEIFGQQQNEMGTGSRCLS
jgi:hypothetical protein